MAMTSWEFLFRLALHYSPRNVLNICCGVDLLPIQSWVVLASLGSCLLMLALGTPHGYRPMDKLLLLQH